LAEIWLDNVYIYINGRSLGDKEISDEKKKQIDESFEGTILDGSKFEPLEGFIVEHKEKEGKNEFHVVKEECIT